MSSEALSLPPVLAPKLHLPRLRPSIVQREAIQARLDAASFVQSSITVKKGDSIPL